MCPLNRQRHGTCHSKLEQAGIPPYRMRRTKHGEVYSQLFSAGLPLRHWKANRYHQEQGHPKSEQR